MFITEQIDLLVQLIVSGYHPETIYLFDSYAAGTAGPDSDIDLFIIQNTDKRKLERNREVRRCIRNYPHTGLDIVVFTPSAVAAGELQAASVGREAVKTGKLLCERK